VNAGSLFSAAVPVAGVPITVPIGVQPGDMMLAQVVVSDGTATNAPFAPAGSA